jgi:hypothetical protein
MTEGAGSRDALVADAIDVLGRHHRRGRLGRQRGLLHVPSPGFGDALPAMADVALRPTFAAQTPMRAH